MVAYKVILAVAVVFLAVIVQIQSRPGVETEFTSIFDEVKSITGNIAKVVEDNTANITANITNITTNITNIAANMTTSAKNHLSDFADGIKTEIQSF
ncbi:unnamed protein product [Macrosiphum euphorbiae]|uniref:Uncharacterized protein n=1 Tax=Macrosiphum euphorbiae TaxID=13131 RepID=A0AAV0XPG8_9HEMI|nr:unnamed protein product [Macrosiphum euphorbiae]